MTSKSSKFFLYCTRRNLLQHNQPHTHTHRHTSMYVALAGAWTPMTFWQKYQAKEYKAAEIKNEKNEKNITRIRSCYNKDNIWSNIFISLLITK